MAGAGGGRLCSKFSLHHAAKMQACRWLLHATHLGGNINRGHERRQLPWMRAAYDDNPGPISLAELKRRKQGGGGAPGDGAVTSSSSSSSNSRQPARQAGDAAATDGWDEGARYDSSGARPAAPLQGAPATGAAAPGGPTQLQQPGSDRLDGRQQEEGDGQPADPFDHAKSVALRRLHTKAMSVAELGADLRQRGHQPDVVQAVLQRLQDVQVLDDAKYAEAYARSQWKQKKKAPGAIRRQLLRKGIARSLVDEALAEVFGPHWERQEVRPAAVASRAGGSSGGDGREEEEGVVDILGWQGATDAEGLRHQLWAAANKHVATMPPGLSEAAVRRRMVSWFARRGHSFAAANSFLQELMRQHTAQ